MLRKIKNLSLAAKRIKKAILHNEDIIIYGDVDPDGVTSVTIIKETIEALGGTVKGYYFPERSKEGYGLNKTALKFLNSYAPALIIMVDLGVGNYEEIKLANKTGFSVVIIDHHKVLKMPPAEVVVDPKQPEETYSFKEFSAAGLCYKLSQLLLKKNIRQAEMERSFSELACLSTIADMMPIKKDNQGIVEEGMKNIPLSSRLGLQLLMKKCSPGSSSIENTVQKMIALLNASRVKQNHLAESFLLLTSNDAEEINDFLIEFSTRSAEHRLERDKAVQEIGGRVAGKETSIIFEGSKHWSVPIAGSVASIVTKQYHRPAFLYVQGPKISTGSVRVPKGVDSVKLMENCSSLLINFGGHPQASGFRLENKNLKKFEKCLKEHYEDKS